ncbi:MAG: WD40-repeat-containing domain protein [Benjaminiella poitrasii]|nr:MAG: WD40-repeat-containing domain protein [Benjaminiella poitrasii]
MEYQRTIVKKYPKLANTKNTAEAKYWKRFKSPIVIKEYASVTSIFFSPVAPYDFAVTSSTRVQVYSSKTHQPKKTISRFKDIAYSGNFRQDGKLIVAGDATGLIQMFDVGSRAILRSFKGHVLPTQVTQFSTNKSNILSASDDKTVRIWDIPSGESVNVFEEHEDYVRAGVVSQDNPNLYVSGSYDQTVKLWDMRQSDSVMTMNHGAPVESLLIYPNGGAVISSGGPVVKVWDLLSGGRCMHTLGNHQKTVTSMCFDGSTSRLITGSLDQHVKIYDVQDYKVVHSVKYPAPILSVGLSPDDTHLAAGMANGLLSIRQRQLKASEKALKKQTQDYIRGGTYKYFMRGQSNTAAKDDFVVEYTKRQRLSKYDQYMKVFQYANALDEVLRTNIHNPMIVTAVLQELIHRDGLKQAITGRDDVSLEPLLRFLIRNIHQPRFTNLLVDVSEAVIDCYTRVFGQSPLIDDLISRLTYKVKHEIQLQKDLIETMATLDMLFTKSGSAIFNK